MEADYRRLSSVSMDVTLLPRITWENQQKSEMITTAKERRAYDGSNGMFLCGSCLLNRVVDDEVEEEIVAAEGATDLAAAL